jgi:hypothetical protein
VILALAAYAAVQFLACVVLSIVAARVLQIILRLLPL